MKGLFDSSDAEELAYRFPTDRFSYVTIRKPRGYELRRLKKLKSSLEWSGTESFSTTLAELTLGVISRIANPHGNGGFLTFISTDATWSAKQMARIVTDEVLCGTATPNVRDSVLDQTVSREPKRHRRSSTGYLLATERRILT